MAGNVVLDVKNVTVQFGGLRANEDVSFDVRRNELFALIGPNGAGKTTCFNVMTGVYQATSGSVISTYPYPARISCACCQRCAPAR